MMEIYLKEFSRLTIELNKGSQPNLMSSHLSNLRTYKVHHNAYKQGSWKIL